MTQTFIKLTTNKTIGVSPARNGAVFLEVAHRDGCSGTIEALYLTGEQARELAQAIMRAHEPAPGLIGVLRHIGQT